MAKTNEESAKNTADQATTLSKKASRGFRARNTVALPEIAPKPVALGE